LISEEMKEGSLKTSAASMFTYDKMSDILDSSFHFYKEYSFATNKKVVDV